LSYEPVVKKVKSTISNKTHFNNGLSGKTKINNYYLVSHVTSHYQIPLSGIEDVRKSISSISLTNNTSIQQKLRTSQPGDANEKEAERIAKQIINTSDPRSNNPRTQSKTSKENLIPIELDDSFSSLQRSTNVQDSLPENSPILDKAIRSPGESLDSKTREFFETRFGYDFKHIRIHADSNAARAADLLGADAYTVGPHIAFANGRYLPGTTEGDHLLAHELTHTIQQAGPLRLNLNMNNSRVGKNINDSAQYQKSSIQIGSSPPHIALQPNRQGSQAKTSSQLKKKLLGQSQDNIDIFVERELGSTQGYDNRLQAISVARISKALPAAIAQSTDQKWHAFETTAFIGTAQGSPSKDTGFQAVEFLSTNTLVEYYLKKVASLKARAEALGKEGGSSNQASSKERDQIIAELTQARKDLAKGVFGVDESEIQFNIRSEDRVPGKINITAKESKDAKGHTGMAPNENFGPAAKVATELNLSLLEKPGSAASTLFHEASHLSDFEFAQKWVKIYEKETNRQFVGGAGIAVFKKWIDAQASSKPPRLSKSDAELVFDEASETNATTEARAYIHTFLTDLQLGASDLATEQLTDYAWGIKNGKIGIPANGSQVIATLISELRTARMMMPKEMQLQFDAAMAAAEEKNSSIWFSEFFKNKKMGKT